MDKTFDTEAPAQRIVMVTGGQRSGKSVFAEKLALSMSPCPVYLATAMVMDEEMRQRVEIHKQRRLLKWRNLEAPFGIEDLTISHDETVLLDCLTKWATNWLFKKKESPDEALSELKRQFDILVSSGASIIIVTNEIGLGGVSQNPLQRKFTDLQGMINQYVASRADEVYMLVSGIPLKIK